MVPGAEFEETTTASISEGSDAPKDSDTGVVPGENEQDEGAQGKGDDDSASEPKEGDLPPGEDETEVPKFVPKTKFKVMEFGTDNQVEHEVPDLLKGLMKDEKSQEEVLALLNKAYGLEPVKQARAKAQQERDQVRKELTGVTGSISELRATYQRGDIDQFLDKLQIPHERMLQWALEKVNYSQLPESQQRDITEKRDAQRRAYAAEQAAGTQEQRIFEQERQTRQLMLDHGLTRPDTSAFSQSYDAKVGKPGAFRDEVIAQGELAWVQSGGKTVLTPDQAIEAAMAKWKSFIVPATTPPGAAAAATTTTKAAPATIPNVGAGRGSSPVKQQPTSIADLKKLRDNYGKTGS